MYAVGVDLGTTYTAAATWRDGKGEIASLGNQAAVIPSVVLLRHDDTFLVGEAANRRGRSEPDRVAREFKRRVGDTTPILLAGTPHSAEALMARLLRAVLDQVTAAEGGPPAALCLTHPANWGPYKTDLLRQAVRLADLDLPVTVTTEPEAAAACYAQQRPIEPGVTVAVYDLGGGTFDAAVLRKTAGGFEILGQPEGIERLGGIDFDAAVFDHVRRALGGKLAELDEDDPAAISAVARLREECTRAKEALSSDTDVAIPVLLPNFSTEVRLTRAELEAMVRPALLGSIEALRRALRSAGVVPERLHSVLLVGGASRMPIVAQLVGAELGRPVTIDTHPKHAVALGAAWLAARSLARPVAPPPPPPPAPLRSPSAAPVPTLSPAAPPPAPRSAPLVGRAAVPPRQPVPDDELLPVLADDPYRRRRWPVLAAGAVLVAVLGTGGIALAVRGDADPTVPPTTNSESPSPSPSPEPSPTPVETEAAEPDETEPAPPPPPPPSPTWEPTPTGSPSEEPAVDMPDVHGLACGYARNALSEEGLMVEMTGPSPDVEAPVVIGQEPAAGTRVAPGSWVAIYCG